MKQLKIIVESTLIVMLLTHGLKGVIVGEGDTYEEALEEVKSAIQFHIETFLNRCFYRRRLLKSQADRLYFQGKSTIIYEDA
jgi:hypothetical protein